MDLLICAGQLLAGPVGERVEDAAVLIAGDRVVAVGRREQVTALAPPDVARVGFPDATVLPGLIDCHVHLAFDTGPDPVAAVKTTDQVTLLRDMAARARQLLDCGVTTVRDLGDGRGLIARLRDMIVRGRLPGPRILAASAPLTPSCGEFHGEDGLPEGIHLCPAISGTWPDRSLRDGAEITEESLKRLRWLHEQGVRLVTGTDRGVPGAGFDDFVDGLQVFHRMGFRNDQIIELATAEAADALGLGDRAGRLAPGFSADLLVVDGDPLVDLDALRDVLLVFAGGHPHMPSDAAKLPVTADWRS